MKITIHIGKSDFNRDPSTEVSQILRRLADQIHREGIKNHPVRDTYGKVIGEMVMEIKSK